MPSLDAVSGLWLLSQAFIEDILQVVRIAWISSAISTAAANAVVFVVGKDRLHFIWQGVRQQLEVLAHTVRGNKGNCRNHTKLSGELIRSISHRKPIIFSLSPDCLTMVKVTTLIERLMNNVVNNTNNREKLPFICTPVKTY